MILTNLLITSFLSFSNPLITHSPGCSITVETQVVNTKGGSKDGSISLQIQHDSGDRYKIFLLNKGPEKAKEEIKRRRMEGLAPGKYEFIIIDTKEEKCFKELSVVVK